MISKKYEAVGLRAVACKHFRWMPGMLVRHGGWKKRITDDWVSPEVYGAWPDFSDPATLGCLIVMVRGTWGDECKDPDEAACLLDTLEGASD